MNKLAPLEVQSIAGSIAGNLTDAWNEGSGEQFAATFTDDAVFINVYGEILRTKISIAKGHQFLFDYAFKDVENKYELIDAVQIDDHTILSHNKGSMPQKKGGLTMTLVIVKQSGRWLIRALHNTTISINPFTKS